MNDVLKKYPVLTRRVQVISFCAAILGGGFAAFVEISGAAFSWRTTYTILTSMSLMQAGAAWHAATRTYQLIRDGHDVPDDVMKSMLYPVHMALHLHLDAKDDATSAVARTAIIYSLLTDAVLMFVISAVIMHAVVSW